MGEKERDRQRVGETEMTQNVGKSEDTSLSVMDKIDHGDGKKERWVSVECFL